VDGSMRWRGGWVIAAAVIVAAFAAVPTGASASGAPGAPAATTKVEWRASTAPVAGLTPAPGVTLGTGVFPDVVSCPAAGSCVSVGAYWDSSSDIHPLIETLSDGSWSALAAPTAGLNPAPAADTLGLEALSCPAVGWCVAVGFYNPQVGNNEGQIDTLANGSWTAQTAPAISGAQVVRLFDVSCPASGSCVAVGVYEDTAGDWHGLIETLANGTWTAATLPAGGLSPAVGTDLALHAVSCPAVGSCVAAGEYEDAARATIGVIATLAGGAWTALTAPEATLNPPPDANPLTYLQSVSCPQPGMCAVAGEYVNTSDREEGLTETLTDGTWTPAAVPGPPDGLLSVTCPASGSCYAVGGGFVATLSGGSWQTAALPTAGLTPAGQSVYAVNAISCPAVGSCKAFGEYSDTSGLEHGYIAKLAHGTWTAEKAPTSGLKPPPSPTANPDDPTNDQAINSGGIACPTASSCVAVGYYEDTAGAFHGLIERQETVTSSPVTK
jgi:hypothetical protein